MYTREKWLYEFFRRQKTLHLYWLSNTHFFVTCRILMAHYTQWCWLAVPLILRGFIRQRSAKRKRFSSFTHVQKLVLGTVVSKEHCLIDFLVDWRPVTLLRPFELCEVFQLALVYSGKKCMTWTFSNGCNCCSQRLSRPSVVVQISYAPPPPNTAIDPSVL